MKLEELLAGCQDGNCRISRTEGQHTNAHCYCDAEKTREVARRLKLLDKAANSLIEQGPNQDTGYYKDRGHQIKAALREIGSLPGQ